jgi:hypothetical protein
MPVPRKKQRPRRRRQQQQQHGDGFFDDLGSGFANLIGLKRGDNFGKAFLKGVIAPLTVGVKGAKEVLDTLHSTNGEKPSSLVSLGGDLATVAGRPVAAEKAKAASRVLAASGRGKPKAAKKKKTKPQRGGARKPKRTRRVPIVTLPGNRPGVRGTMTFCNLNDYPAGVPQF